MMQFKIQYAVGTPSTWHDYMTYETPNPLFDSEEEALQKIMEIRGSGYNVTRRFAVKSIETLEAFVTVVEPVRQPEPVDDEADFEVIDNRNMGIQGSVEDGI